MHKVSNKSHKSLSFRVSKSVIFTSKISNLREFFTLLKKVKNQPSRPKSVLLRFWKTLKISNLREFLTLFLKFSKSRLPMDMVKSIKSRLSMEAAKTTDYRWSCHPISTLRNHVVVILPLSWRPTLFRVFGRKRQFCASIFVSVSGDYKYSIYFVFWPKYQPS